MAIELRLTNQPGLLSELATDLVSREVALIVTTGSPSSALAAKAATSTIPVAFVSAATKFDFVINLKTAKAMNLTIPRMLLVAAAKVIE